MATSKAFLIVVAGALIAPLVTWWPMLAYRFPWIGLPAYPAAQGIDLWGAQAFWLAAFWLLAGVIWATDRWLACAVAFVGLGVFFRGAMLDPTHSVMFALGALMVLAMRQAPLAWHLRIRLVLAGIGLFQCAYMLQQWAGYDVLWGPLFGGKLLPKLQTIGTLGTVDAAAATLAMTAPLMPWFALPFVVAVVYYAHSLGAWLALGVGLAVALFFRRRKILCYALVLAMVVGTGLFMQTKSTQTIYSRTALWRYAAAQWVTTEPVVGWGLGGYSVRVPYYQQRDNFIPNGMRELWREAHNEPLQWVFETGLVGLVILVGWLWTHRAMFRDPLWGGSLAALGVNSLSFFPLHVVPLALMAVILVGVATPQQATPDPSPAPQEWGSET